MRRALRPIPILLAASSLAFHAGGAAADAMPSDVVASAGDQAAGGGYALAFTLGEGIVGGAAWPFLYDVMAGFWHPGGPRLVGVDDEATATSSVALRVSPNPFVAGAAIHFTLPAATRECRLHVFDVGGRTVRALASGPAAPGEREVTWDGRDDRGRAVPGGVYLLRLQAGAFTEVRRIARVR